MYGYDVHMYYDLNHVIRVGALHNHRATHRANALSVSLSLGPCPPLAATTKPLACGASSLPETRLKGRGGNRWTLDLGLRWRGETLGT